MSIDRLRGEVEFKGLGDGVSLMYRLADCRELQKAYGADWFTGAEQKLRSFDIEFILVCLKHGLKKDGKPLAVKVEDLDRLSLAEVVEQIANGLFAAIYGKTTTEILEEAKSAPLESQA